ncbi:MAG: hypothetical protein ABI051_12105 [Vicinamibacterales bacterium]
MPGGLLNALHDTSVMSVELRPPRAELDAAAGRDAWIDTYHAVKGLVGAERFVFLTDSAVGAREEHNLRHLVINLGADVPRDHVVPFLTTKHPLEFCLTYAEQALHEGFRSLVVLGGDRTVGPARCVNHAWELRLLLQRHVPELLLGGWANPHGDAAAQVGFLSDDHFHAEYFLTQVVSHHDMRAVDAFMAERERRHVTAPGVFGVFYYRSANARTLNILKQFLPVPTEALTREFAEGASAETVCARTIRALRHSGVKHVYVSNLPVASARQTLGRILAIANS